MTEPKINPEPVAEPVGADTLLVQGSTYESALRDLLKLAKEENARVETVAGVPILLAKNEEGDIEAKSIKSLMYEYAPKPVRREGTAKLLTLESFIEHTNRFKDENSILFAGTYDKPELTSVLDYHPQGPDNGSARFGKHRGLYTFKLSKEWTIWHSYFDKEMTLKQFAELIENRITDIDDELKGLDPGTNRAWKFVELLNVRIAKSSEILQLARGLTLDIHSRVSQHHSLSSGEQRTHLETTHRDIDSSSPPKIPGAFALAIPVFEGDEDLYRLPVRLRYEANDKDGFKFTLLPHRTDLTLKEVYARHLAKVKQQTGLPILVGAPE